MRGNSKRSEVTSPEAELKFHQGCWKNAACLHTARERMASRERVCFVRIQRHTCKIATTIALYARARTIVLQPIPRYTVRRSALALLTAIVAAGVVASCRDALNPTGATQWATTTQPTALKNLNNRWFCEWWSRGGSNP